ncbi:tubulin-specific chaperone C [Chanos chanos]|uniref:Tubulin-specific chaperone C n=1 Tax=Chanos chanos TaxID=29144 RepID=A0A6J2VHF7_CHACN|nr:tubulin-specific chaperone C [Chanos chanos]
MEVGAGNGDTGLSDTVKIPERLLRRDQARLEEAERRKDAKESQTVSEEKSDFFSATFNSEKAAIEHLINTCPGTDRDAACKTLEEVTHKIQQLQKFLNDSMMFLTSYELRQAQASVQKLQSSLAEKRDVALPKKKFAFRSRQAGAAKNTETTQSTAATEKSKSDSVVGSVLEAAISADMCGFSNADSKVLTKKADEIQQRDVLLSHLTNCKVTLYGSPSTLHIKNVRNCQILCGPVSSSVFVDQCSGCTLSFPCQQLRTHNTTDTKIYLHVTSRAIIEDCQNVAFAPFTWTYPGMDDDFIVSGLDRERNNWSQVDDFNWLAANTPSPNWSVIPEAVRTDAWEIAVPSE